ncbi:MAG: glutamate-5-semialdehyde dehydrogenase [Candidatus Pedobacter colombiensis]|uniref:Gamma-glutamyl phosphate reductase n=1 Tax=Candidatus Pedobacter colombiensis TaxID=3121371 RepID=A0AAJ5WDW2_9SPHI|nr:glutamate-5-semialdehyde dehydrogenase [Pedobacter sp.]WEK21791.1 MAG: glutamate-5-semialdehyde dehydrogenase [Pedobacter sp.]
MESIQQQLINAKKAQQSISSLSDKGKQDLINDLAKLIKAQSAEIIAENLKDLEKMPVSDPKWDRLLLNEARILALASSLNDVASLDDPTNRVLSENTLTNGLFIQKKTVPIGVVGVIYESRPNVTIDVAALCIRSGNVCLLRGGQDAYHTNLFIVSLIQRVLTEHGLDKHVVQQLPADRKYILDILQAEKYIDVIIPRGSNQLIEFVRKNALVPVIETGAGVCHTYIEKTAKLAEAADIVVNAKVSRPSVCNALDTIVVDSAVAEPFLNLIAPLLSEYNVEMFADERSFPILKQLNYPKINKAAPEDFGREFLDFKCSVKVVDHIDEALAHIANFSSKHSEAIVTEDHAKAERFLNEVDAAVVYLNASTRFTDGQVFGLGAEIGISTQKLHARGPFALEKLVTEKWVVRGAGQVR